MFLKTLHSHHTKRLRLPDDWLQSISFGHQVFYRVHKLKEFYQNEAWHSTKTPVLPLNARKNSLWFVEQLDFVLVLIDMAMRHKIPKCHDDCENTKIPQEIYSVEYETTLCSAFFHILFCSNKRENLCP